MVDARIQKDLLGVLETMSLDEQRRVLRFAHAISGSLGPGKSGGELSGFAGSLTMEEADRMDKVIEEGCEQVNHDEWRLPS